MSDVQDQRPAKRRGRPPTNPSAVDDAALKARRQRNREAQNIFRRRRQAADAAQAKRLGRLEEVVEEMSSVFVAFVDEMLASHVVSQQPELVSCLRRSMRRVLDLANEVVGPDEVEGAPPVATAAAAADAPPLPPPNLGSTISHPHNSSHHIFPATSSTTSPPGLSSTSSHTSDDTVECDLHLAIPVPPGIATNNIPELETPPNQHLLKQQQQQQQTPSSSSSSSLSPQIYGNGWTVHNHPILGANMSEYWGPRVPLSRDSFAFRLARASLTIAYLILTRNHHPPLPLAEENRIFGSRLHLRGRDDLLIRLRWLLGPGSDYMYRVVDLPYGQHGDHIFTRSDLDPGVDELGWPGVVRARHEKDSSASSGTRYLSILGVEKQLLALGGRIVDAETLELNILNPAASPNPPPEVVSSQPDSWSFVDFYSPTRLRPEPQVLTLRLSMNLLVSNLAKTAVCLMRGPGYPRDALGAAIQGSVIKVG